MHRTLTILALVVLYSVAHSQTKQVNIEVQQSLAAYAKLHRYHLGNPMLIDSVTPTKPGVFSFSSPTPFQPGLYRVSIGQNINFDFVIDNEPSIDIFTKAFAPEESLVSTSTGNNIYWAYQNRKRNHDHQAWLIRSLKDFYPDSLLFGLLLNHELIRLNNELLTIALQKIKSNPNELFSKILLAEQLPAEPPLPTSRTDREALRAVWWQGVNLADETIIHTPGVANRFWRFVDLLFYDDLSKEEQDQALIEGLESFLSGLVPRSRELFRQIIVQGFKDTDYHDVAYYFAKPPLDSPRADLKPAHDPSVSATDTQIRVGERAFDFSFKGVDGKKLHLSDVDAEYKLVLFWTSWCPYCLETLPGIMSVYSRFRDRGLEVIAVSIDEEDEPWFTHVSSKELRWINTRIPFSASNQTLLRYNVDETPKMYLLSRDLTVLSRPANQRQLQSKLNKLLR